MPALTSPLLLSSPTLPQQLQTLATDTGAMTWADTPSPTRRLSTTPSSFSAGSSSALSLQFSELTPQTTPALSVRFGNSPTSLTCVRLLTCATLCSRTSTQWRGRPTRQVSLSAIPSTMSIPTLKRLTTLKTNTSLATTSLYRPLLSRPKTVSAPKPSGSRKETGGAPPQMNSLRAPAHCQ